MNIFDKFKKLMQSSEPEDEIVIEDHPMFVSYDKDNRYIRGGFAKVNGEKKRAKAVSYGVLVCYDSYKQSRAKVYGSKNKKKAIKVFNTLYPNGSLSIDSLINDPKFYGYRCNMTKRAIDFEYLCMQVLKIRLNNIIEEKTLDTIKPM